MKLPHRTTLFLALSALAAQGADASTAYGDLNNFDTVNDTGHECHGFEIEIEGIHSTDITYTYDWNHYGAPRITEDTNPRPSRRCSSATRARRIPMAVGLPSPRFRPCRLTPTDGHSCTNPSVNEGCEHFGVGYYGAPTAIRYHWLVDDGSGTLVPQLAGPGRDAEAGPTRRRPLASPPWSSP